MRIKSIVERLKAADQAYYNLGKPVMTDAEYDALRDKLAKLAPTHPYLAQVGAPVRAGEAPLPIKMLSLRKVRPADVPSWVKFTGVKEFWALPKLDGLAGLLHYRNGRLIAAYTRGDGVIGQNVTHTAQHVFGVHGRLQGAPYTDAVWRECDLFIKGEIVIDNTRFRALKEAGEDWKHPRNFAVGQINSKEPVTRLLQEMTFVAYGAWRRVGNRPATTPPSVHVLMLYLSDLGFPTVLSPARPRPWKGEWVSNASSDLRPIAHITSSVDWKAVHDRITAAVDIVTDGIVVVPEDLRTVAKLGNNDTHPRGMIAVKLDRDDQKGAVGTVKEIRWELSKRKLLKPVLVLAQPVTFNGVDVQRATLNNAKTVLELKTGPGAKVDIIRSGDVIPFVRSVVKPAKVELPKRCPACNGRLTWTRTGVDLVCENPKCTGADERVLRSFIGTLGIDWISSGFVDKLAERGITTIPQLLELPVAAIRRLPGMGETSAAKIRASLDKALHGVQLPRLMHACGTFTSAMVSLGETRLTAICKAIGYRRVLTITPEAARKALTTAGVEGIGQAAVDIFCQGLPEFQALYQKIGKYHTEPVIKLTSNRLQGQVVCFTGFRDAALVRKIKEAGGEYSDSFTRKTTLLVAAESGTTKVNKAKDRGIPVVSPEAFRKSIA